VVSSCVGHSASIYSLSFSVVVILFHVIMLVDKFYNNNNNKLQRVRNAAACVGRIERWQIRPRTDPLIPEPCSTYTGSTSLIVAVSGHQDSQAIFQVSNNTHRRRRRDETVELRRVGGVNTFRN